ncbi:MAG: formylglycine-generating enzyme family protein [Bacteroidia bacterium]
MHKLSLAACGWLLVLAPLVAQQVPGTPTYTETLPGTTVGWEMVLIPGGTFTMGSPEDEEGRMDDEGPQITVRLDSFWMGKFELPYEVYEVFRDKSLDNDSTRLAGSDYSVDAITRPSPPYEDPTFGMGKDGFPAVSMTQYAALKFCKWLWQKTGHFYRLPTEAEWEYACRAGTTTAYSFGDDASELDEYAWYYENSESAYHKVGTKKPNPWGLYDMHGNVAEWCLDQYQADYYATVDTARAENVWRRPERLHPRTVRGGSWDDDAEELRSANRIQSSMNWKKRDPQIPKSYWWNTDSPFVGFRLVRPIPQPSPEEVRMFWKVTLDE